MNHSKVDQKERDSRKQYRVIADREKGDDPRWADAQSGDRFTHVGILGGESRLVRIERPVPTADTRSQMERDSDALDELRRTPVPVESPSLPTREQIAEVIYTERAGSSQNWHKAAFRDDYLKEADAVLALLQKGFDR